MNATITYIYIRTINFRTHRGVLQLGHRSFPCLLGRNGQTFSKREGDGKSPKGRWRLELLYLRPGHHARSRLKQQSLKRDYGWCDAVDHKDYNRRVTLPFAASHEKLWRDDEAYDLMVTTSHNHRPRVKGRGSAIFFHLIHSGAKFTEGCIALKARDMRLVLAACTKNTYLVI